MNLYYKMLKRKYKKRRNKKGGRNFFDAFSQGTGEIKAAAEIAKNKSMEAAATTQQGIADFEASRKAHLQRSMMAGEYSDLAKSLMKKNIASNPIGFAKQRQLAANLRDPIAQKMIENRNPNLSPMKLRRTRGGKRKSRRRKKSRKRKTRRKKRGGLSAPMAYKKRVDRQEEAKQWSLNREMQAAKKTHDEKKQEKIKDKLRASFNRQAYWKTPGDAKNKDVIASVQLRKAMPGIEDAIKAKTLVPRKTRQTGGRKKRKTRRKRRR